MCSSVGGRRYCCAGCRGALFCASSLSACCQLSSRRVLRGECQGAATETAAACKASTCASCTVAETPTTCTGELVLCQSRLSHTIFCQILSVSLTCADDNNLSTSSKTTASTWAQLSRLKRVIFRRLAGVPTNTFKSAGILLFALRISAT